MRNYSYDALLYFPPLYPLLLTLLNILGVDVHDASIVINIVALGLIILLTGDWLSRHLNSRLLVAGTVAIITVSHIMNLVALFAMPETLFILLTLLALQQLDTFLSQRNSMRVLSLSALFAVLAFLTRSVGISVIFTTVLLIIINPRISIKRRVQYTVFYGAITLTPLLVYSVYIRTILRPTIGTQLRALEFTPLHYLMSIIEFLHGWLFVPQISNIHTLNIGTIGSEATSSNSAIVLWTAVITIMLITFIYTRNNDTCEKKLQTGAAQCGPQASIQLSLILISYTLIYLLILYAALIYLSFIHPGYIPAIKYRYIFPIYIPVLACIVLIFERFFRRKFGGIWSILLKVCVSCVIAFSCMIYITRATQWNISLTDKALEFKNYKPYLQGYTLDSPIIEYLNNNRLEGDIFVNHIPVLYRLTDIMPPVRPIDCSNQLNQFTNSSPSHKERILNPIYIILLTRVPNYRDCSLQEPALQNSHLELIVETSDGLIYKINFL